SRPRRISLPTYPFAGERCWINLQLNTNQGKIENCPDLVPIKTPTELTEIQDEIPIETLKSIILGSNLRNHLKSRKKTVKKLRKKLQRFKLLENTLYRLLLVQLQSLGLFNHNGSISDWPQLEKHSSERNRRWLEQSISLLTDNGFVEKKKDGTLSKKKDFVKNRVWKGWYKAKKAWIEDPQWAAYVLLMEKMLLHLPEILSNKVSATDIMFPGGSMELVEGIYKNNPIADLYNELLGHIVFNLVHSQRKQNSTSAIRILEIGAGTGMASTMVFDKLNHMHDYIQEYCYTDVSLVFLQYAEEKYGKANPYLTFKVVNIESPIVDQEIDVGGYDVVIAANVLHATKDIRWTVNNAKSALKKNGLLLLNEISENSLFAQLTFGLLEGWWLFNDSDLRIAGCPGLLPSTWHKILSQEGFNSIFFPAEKFHDLGQQIVVATSDGKLNSNVLSSTNSASQLGNNRCLLSQVDLNETESFLLQTISELVGVSENDLDIHVDLKKYGLDSIMISKAYMSVQKKFGKVLSPKDMVEYKTVKQLADFISRQTENDSPTCEKTESMHSEIYQVSSDRKYEIVSIGKGRTIIFLTGLAFSWRIWTQQILHLKNYYKLVFVGFPGHGKSKSISGEFTFQDLSDDLFEIINHHKYESPHLVGWCMGGNVAQLFAAKHSDKLNTLILVSTYSEDGGEEADFQDDYFNYLANPIQVHSREFKNCFKANPDMEERTNSAIQQLQEGMCKLDDHYIINYIDNLSKFESTDYLKEINIPVLIISGKWDAKFPTSSLKRLQARINSSQLCEFENSGHFPFITEYKRFGDKLIDFYRHFEK
ncbi:MAG: alpha/beta fold hydrolase, partial [Proteobacteria bacterium]|nr:alpha/beta fold hydrolase [Pseudomonadota bacterium]